MASLRPRMVYWERGSNKVIQLTLGVNGYEKLGWQFVDADLGLEFRIGKTVNEILGKKDIESFYLCQFDILSKLIKKENIVVTIDASVICNDKNRQLLQIDLFR